MADFIISGPLDGYTVTYPDIEVKTSDSLYGDKKEDKKEEKKPKKKQKIRFEVTGDSSCGYRLVRQVSTGNVKWILSQELTKAWDYTMLEYDQEKLSLAFYDADPAFSPR